MSMSPEMQFKDKLCREWEWTTGDDAKHLPTDLTPSLNDDPCYAGFHGWGCTRVRGHTGRHAAGDSRKILAVWEQR